MWADSNGGLSRLNLLALLTHDCFVLGKNNTVGGGRSSRLFTLDVQRRARDNFASSRPRRARQLGQGVWSRAIRGVYPAESIRAWRVFGNRRRVAELHVHHHGGGMSRIDSWRRYFASAAKENNRRGKKGICSRSFEKHTSLCVLLTDIAME